jgi:iron(III) transport system substrate-binding protein
MRNVRAAGALSAMVLVSLAIAACGSSSRPTKVKSASTTKVKSASTTKVKSASTIRNSRPTLVVYSAQGYDHAMVSVFQKATGIPTALDDNSTGPLLTQIEASKNNPNWGLLWVDGDTAFAGLDQQGLLMKGFEPSVSWNALGRQVVPKDKSYTPTGITLMAALVYNSKKVSAPPSSWQQLLGSQWKGAVGMNDPAQSGPTFPFIAGMMSYLTMSNPPPEAGHARSQTAAPHDEPWSCGTVANPDPRISVRPYGGTAGLASKVGRHSPHRFVR